MCSFNRTKHHYAEQDITKLFKAKNFDSNELVLDEEKGHLPLHLFDNEDFETQTPSQW